MVEDHMAQDKIVGLLEEASQQILNKHEGFISSRIYKSLDGTKVINHVKWRNKQTFEKLLSDPRMLIHMNDIDNLAKAERSLCELVYVDKNR
jgi:hypothetical protein